MVVTWQITYKVRSHEATPNANSSCDSKQSPKIKPIKL